MIDWEDVLKTIGSTAVVAALITWAIKALISQFLKRDLKSYEDSLRQASALALEERRNELKRETDLIIAGFNNRSQAALSAQKAESDRLMALFQVQLTSAAARGDRIREELKRWANPVLGAVRALHARLENILANKGYLALSEATVKDIPPGWSVTHAYFLSSTVFLMAQYFCCMRLVEERLGFDLFNKHEEKDEFLDLVRSVGETLSIWPHPALGDRPPVDDKQLFGLQRRCIGEMMCVGEGEAVRCMRFSEFLTRYEEEPFSRSLAPLVALINGLHPGNADMPSALWRRFQLMQEALERLQAACERILRPAEA